jgi:hypothetical protein
LATCSVTSCTVPIKETLISREVTGTREISRVRSPERCAVIFAVVRTGTPVRAVKANPRRNPRSSSAKTCNQFIPRRSVGIVPKIAAKDVLT